MQRGSLGLCVCVCVCVCVFLQQCEDLEDGVSLGHIFRIVRGAIMLNDPQLLEELLKVRL